MKPGHAAVAGAASCLGRHAIALLAGWVAVCPAWAQWNGTNPVWTSSKAGIGTQYPFSALHLKASGGDAYLTLANNVSGKYWYQGFLDDGRFALSYSADLISFPARLIVDTAGNVGIPATNSQYKLAVNGTIGAREVIVTSSGWSDYVFRPGYRLRPLSEVHAYIRIHRRLPDIPSEAEVRAKGVSVGAM